ncbi:SatD family protein [Aquiflexum lacus]|uniref:SatD family protein n=1 Tax=Aquiflexum lacus TaxID=2483805 RepID=UPI001895B88F|nr:SatD family protein [Aquiflexum lacus]
MHRVPILMADIKGSSKVPAEKLMKQFRALVGKVNTDRKENIKSPLTITLGDEFQGVIDTFENGIKIIFELEEEIVSSEFDFKLRYVLLEGQIDTEINEDIAYQMLGSGLTSARKDLEELKKGDRRFLIKSDKDPKDVYLNKAFNIYQNFVDSWKEKALVKEFLNFDDYKIVAKHIGLDPSNAWRRKRSLNIVEYKDIKDLILVIQ